MNTYRAVPRQIEYLANLPGMAASATPQNPLTVNRRIHAIYLANYESGTLAAPTAAKMPLIQVFVNGKVWVQATPVQLIAYSTFLGITPATGIIPIYMSNPRIENPRISEMSSWDLFGQKSAAIKITWGASAATPSINMAVEFDDLRNTRKVNGVDTLFSAPRRLVSLTLPALGSGEVDMQAIPVDEPIHKMLFNVSANAISRIDVKADTLFVGSYLAALNTANLAAYGYAAGAFDFPLCWDYPDNYIKGGEIACGSINVHAATTGALTPTLLLETRGPGF